MNMRSVSGGRGWQWLVDGFRLFRLQPLIWIALVAIMVVIWIVSAFIPLLGPLAMHLVFPVFIAGLMTACRTTADGGEPQLGQLFVAFPTHATPLVTVGGIYLVGNVVAAGIMLAVAGGGAVTMLMSKGGDPAALGNAIRAVGFGLMVGMLVFLPVLMAVWFAPMLVYFRGMSPVDAMKASFAACLGNMMPFLVYSIAGILLWILAAIPLMLGFIVLLPVFVCSLYASYRDIFPEDDPEKAVSAAPGNPLLK